MHEVLGIVVAALGCAVVLNILAKKINIPTIIGYIFTGLIISLVFDLSHNSKDDSEMLHSIAEYGIVFLMFMIGLEFSADKIKSMKNEVLILGHLQVAISALILMVIAIIIFNLDFKTAIIIANALALSSTAVVLKILNEQRELKTIHGKKILGILIFQDLAVIPILLSIELLTSNTQNIAILVGQVLLNALIVLFLIFYPGKWLFQRFLKFAADTKLDEVFVGSILFILLLSAYTVEQLGFSTSLGAFLAGMVIAETKYKYQVEADLAHFRDLLLGLFFITVGMQLNLNFFIQNLHYILLLLIAVLVLKSLIIYALTRLFTDARNSIKVAIALSQVGEFSFVIFELSRKYELLDNYTHQLLLLTVILSMIATPFILKNLNKIANIFIKSKVFVMNMHSNDELSDHVVVCGYGTFGREVVEYLKVHQIPYIAVDYNQRLVSDGILRGDRVIFGNVANKHILEKLRVKEASAVIIAIDDAEKMRIACESILDMSPNCQIIVKVKSDEEMMMLADLNIYRIINEKVEIAKMLAQAASVCELNQRREKE